VPPWEVSKQAQRPSLPLACFLGSQGFGQRLRRPRLPREDAFLAPCHSTSLLQVQIKDAAGHRRAGAACSFLVLPLNLQCPFQQRCDLSAIQDFPRQVEDLVADRPNAGTRSTEEQPPGDRPARVLVPCSCDEQGQLSQASNRPKCSGPSLHFQRRCFCSSGKLFDHQGDEERLFLAPKRPHAPPKKHHHGKRVRLSKLLAPTPAISKPYLRNTSWRRRH